MSLITSFFRTTVPTLGLFALLAVPTSFLASAEGEPAVKTDTAMKTCPVCNKSMKDVTDKRTTNIDGRAVYCCSDKCAEEVSTNKDYYKGYYDGHSGVNRLHIGPKGGDTRKGPQTDPTNR